MLLREAHKLKSDEIRNARINALEARRQGDHWEYNEWLKYVDELQSMSDVDTKKWADRHFGRG